MLLWDPHHLIPFNDIVEVQGPPTEIPVVQTRSKIQPIQSNPTTTHSSQGDEAFDQPKPMFSSQKNPMEIHTLEIPKLDYNIVEYLKKMKANVFFMDMCTIPQQKDFLLHALKLIDTSITNINQDNAPSPIESTNNLNVKTCSLGEKRNAFCPSFPLDG